MQRLKPARPAQYIRLEAGWFVSHRERAAGMKSPTRCADFQKTG